MGRSKDSLILAFARSLSNFQKGDLETIYEPVSDTLIGKRLFGMGIGRKAREEISGLLEVILETNPCIIPSTGGSYSRMDHLSSVPYDKGVVDGRARRLFSRIPKGLVRAVIGHSYDIAKEWNSSAILVGLSDKEKMARSDYYPSIAYVETSACNRGCRHCASMATPDLANVTFDEIVRGFERLPPSLNGVAFAHGEPFRWTDRYDGQTLNLGHAFLYILDRFPDISHLAAVTSGINFDDPLESGAARILAQGVPEGMRKRVILSISLSDFPHFRMKNAKGIEAARKAQVDTIRFSIENGFRLGFVSFLEHEQYVSEIAIRACSELLPKSDGVEVFGFNGMQSKRVELYGRAAIEAGEYSPDDPSLGDWGRCLACSAIGVPPKSDLRKILRKERFQVQTSLTLSHGGDLGPGCCTHISQHAVISNIGKPYEQIREDTTAFVRRIKRMKMDKELTCFRCLGAADHIRDPGRFKKIVGPDNARLIPASKLARRIR